ncbi:MAG TPA: tetratricopeptide repeat protein [Burkholderiales bacterium]|nr:tetratricopeptide repeat protein [Burkholderiales bacterium]
MALELVLRARHCLSLDRLAEAEALARQACATPASAADAWHIIASVHRRAGKLEAAEAALRQAIQRDANAAAYHNELGNLLQDRGRLKDAIAAYRRALRLYPGFAEAWNDLGTARYAKGELEAAVDCYQRALRLRPDHVVAYANLGAVCRKLGLLRDARRALQKELWYRLRQGAGALWRRRSAPGLHSAARLAALAEAQMRVGNPRHAAEIAGSALNLEPRNVAALRALGMALARQGRAGEALTIMRQATELRPGDADLQFQLARILAALERFDEAIAAYEAACRLRPEPRALAELAQLHLQHDDAAAAERVLRQALQHAPQDAGLHAAIGDVCQRQNRFEEAEAALRRALELDRRHFAAQVRLCELLRDTGRLEEAEAAAQRALELDDEAVASHFSLGMVHKAKGRMEPAMRCFRRALELDPGATQAMQQLALALREEDRLEEAEAQLRAALRLRPDNASLLADHGMVLADLMRYDEALACLDRALARAPHSVMAINRKALIVDHLGDRVQGLALLREAARLAPNDDHAKYNIGLHHLKYGNYAAGWDGYERRRSFESFVGKHRRFPLPEWDGSPLAGRTLLVQPEQGLGDEIMFGSCIPEVAAQAKHVIVECDAKLEAIFRRSFPECTVVSRQRTLANDWVQRIQPRPDVQIAAGSLACRLRRAESDFPRHQGFLHADAEKVGAWRARLGALGPGRKIGLSWQGGVGFTGRKRRSLTLEQLLPILRLPGIEFVNLQYTEVREEMRALESRHGVKVHHWQEAIDDYDQTAALVMALDSVLTVCTAIVHLTGALGRPALVMVPFGPDWRYGAAGERMIWYPSVRLLRQRRIGEWREVLQEVSSSISS